AAIKEKYIRNGILYFKPDLNQSFNSFKLISGTITVTDGPSSGSSDEFYITIKGKGGHASAPHRSVDPIFIAAQVYIGIQGFLNRTVDPIAPIIFTIGKIEGGSRHNIISETCYMEGTLRTLDEDLRDHLIDEIPKKIKEFALIYGGDAEIDIRRGYAVGYNDKEINDHVRKAVIDLYGEDSLYVNNTPILGSEDFYEFRLRGKIPISMFGLGGRNEAKGFISSNHSNYFDFDEDALPIGVAVLTQTALNYLSS
ncbi:MAG: M20/M25/M40 family metallo-hydrolase, partial [Candidatus Heimdallarchaeota archaeon]|nr:M20/M25/M40 family metallo-hydrolase [Candidatus Heimdallarchaeota archaeon]